MSGIFEVLVTAAVGVFILAFMDFLCADRRDRWSLRTYLLVVLGFMLATAHRRSRIRPLGSRLRQISGDAPVNHEQDEHEEQ